METGTRTARSATARLKEKDSTAAGPAPRPPLSMANAAAPPPIEFTGREDVDALLDEKMEGTKVKGKAVVMSEYIPKLQACTPSIPLYKATNSYYRYQGNGGSIKYLLEREVVNLAEISKLNGLVDAADESTYGQRTAAGPAPRPLLSTASQNAVAPPPTEVSIEFAGREDVDALLDKKFKRRHYSGKSEEMSEYIKKGCAFIKWLLEREDANLVEIEKLNGLIDVADKHRPEIELESKVEESVAMKEELQRGESLKMLQEYNTSLQQYNCHLQADAIKSAETIGKLQKENNAKAAEINLLLIRLGAFKELAGKCSTELENAIIQCASLEETCSKQDETIKLLQFQVAQNEKERLKSDKCPMAWSSVESINQEELHQKLVQSDNFEQVLDTETDQLRKVSQNYENDKKLWAAAISNLESKIKAMKQEQALLSLEAHKFAQVIPDSSKMIEAVRALVAQCDDLKVKYHEEVAKRKKLRNIVLEIKGNIRVFCRCRPLSKVEKSSGFKGVVDFDGANDGEIGIMTGGTGKKIFTFDRVYTPKDDNAEVYADASPLVTSVLDGYNVCIFAYGQTGSGKTFTMEGTEGNRGVNCKTLEELFKIAEERKHTVRHDMYVSVLEVYNEQIRDLLATSSSSKNLEIKQAGERSHHVPGIVEAKVRNIKEVWDVLQTGSTSRAVASNNVNERSSRSHCMLCIMVTAKNLINGDCTKSKLCLVDLAGSERLTKTDPQGDRLKEAVNINKSLSALGDVISALASRSSHIPYRRGFKSANVCANKPIGK